MAIPRKKQFLYSIANGLCLPLEQEDDFRACFVSMRTYRGAGYQSTAQNFVLSVGMDFCVQRVHTPLKRLQFLLFYLIKFDNHIPFYPYPLFQNLLNCKEL
jgi:hypothetical protein